MTTSDAESLAKETLDLAKEILDLAKRRGALQFGKFQLSAGGVSPYYFDGRLLTLDPEGAYLVGDALLPLLAECGAEAIAGPDPGRGSHRRRGCTSEPSARHPHSRD